ncbi:MAG: hypothetical protein Q7U54_03645 [Bacteroidales bacterium]|nr:hypothetical protein [Bacteroidales bacterium]
MNSINNDKAGFLSRLSQKSLKRNILLFAFFTLTFMVVFAISGYYSAFKTTSFLPDNISNFTSTSPGSSQIEIKGFGYILGVDPDGSVIIKSMKREVIMSDLRYYAEYEGENGNWGLKNVFVQRTNDSTITIKGESQNRALVKLALVTHKFRSKLDVRVNTIYKASTVVTREALVAEFNVPVAEVYLKNRKIDKQDFEDEYWLNKEGVRFGTNDRSALIYHTPYISSLQLETAKKLLFINLDFYLDHPFAHMPFLEKGNGKIEDGGDLIDQSKSNYSKGSERNNSFSINFGNLPTVTPRLMSVPYGYQAGYIVTEHADGGNIQTQRAVYFGSEDILKASDAVGGFVGHKIPTTKSVFYMDSASLSGAAIFGKQNDTLLLRFLDQIYATGLYDLCLHTPENLSSNRKVLEESIRFMKNRYNAETWIDHGFFGGLINRECLAADGLDTNSKYYAADLWKKYNTQYFWSPAIEFIEESSHISITSKIKKFKFYDAYVSFWKHYLCPRDLKAMSPIEALNELSRRFSVQNELNSLKPHTGDSHPTPLYWQNPTRTNDFYSWATDYSQTYNDLSPKVVKGELVQLTNLVNDWGVFISHGYYVREYPSHLLIKDQNSKLHINPYFDEILGLIAQKRDKGELYTTTVKDLLDYWTKLDKISFDYLPNGEVSITNHNNMPINGLSIVVRAKNVKINGKVLPMKRVGDDTIIWFDIKSDETLHLKIIQ